MHPWPSSTMVSSYMSVVIVDCSRSVMHKSSFLLVRETPLPLLWKDTFLPSTSGCYIMICRTIEGFFDVLIRQLQILVRSSSLTKGTAQSKSEKLLAYLNNLCSPGSSRKHFLHKSVLKGDFLGFGNESFNGINIRGV